MKMALIGILTLAHGVSSATFAADTATLTITGQVVSLTCHTDIVAGQLRQLCGHDLYPVDAKYVSSISRGVVTKTVNVPGDLTRKVIVSSYD
ncbi:DUF2574 family protein [Klebsiella sp. RHBSTW-00215]|uniref:DUF2574 family protein n=1 Tax=unclassified Klebsiella TaxID=2608929 RepID=UPI0015F69456|nr:DUF2574 family protein [Klebsiella sp. RHBSTW-00215]MBA7931743.1 DUF2574 family protein [Klebsiella sp. RHBSTW-00215]